MTGTYNHWMVGLSVLIAMCASYAALDLAGRTAEARGGIRTAWLLGGAASMGLGIWSMHYVGMLAFELPLAVLYHLPTVFISLLAAIFASAVALFVVSRARWNWWGAMAGSLAMGGGIASMHYIGMDAMRLPAHMHWNVAIVVISVVIAIVVSLVALWLAFRFRSETRDLAPLKIASAAVMGVAVVAMHYTGMAAATFMPSETGMSGAGTSISSLGIAGVVLVTFVVLGFTFLTSLVDRKLSAQGRVLELQTGLLDAQESLRRHATLDHLTGLWNRRMIVEQLDRELSGVRRDQSSLTVAMVDIDRFKAINDTHGHAAGDAVLRDVAASIRSQLRSYDSVGRYGGEEFLLLLPGCGAESGSGIAERVRTRIEISPTLYGELTLRVTASLGLASTKTDGTDAAGLIDAADAALYRAKAKGSNRVEETSLRGQLDFSATTIDFPKQPLARRPAGGER